MGQWLPNRWYQITNTCDHPVYRFRLDDSITSSVPLSEPAQRITAEARDVEKEGDIKIEVQETQAAIVRQDHEEFEWREVIRGLSV